MRYWNGQRHVETRSTLIPDIRSHVATWRRFQQETRVLPVLSIATYFLRFVLMAAGVVGVLWYGVANHGWSKGPGALSSIAGVSSRSHRLAHRREECLEL
jgi:hypothetical protein